MQTNFSLAQLADPDIAEADKILRTCVHCGFCTATCPTYVLLGDELDSPRGRIYLIKDMLEKARPASAELVKHVDRCLTCLSCMTTCPSGVHYMHLVDHARHRIAETYRRPMLERLLHRLLSFVLPSPWRFRMALMGAWFGRPLAGFLPGRLGAMFKLAPAEIPAPSPMDRPQVFAAEGLRKGRAALMTGCAQQVLAPEINEATIRLLTRHGIEVVVAKGAGCCGALVHHMGDADGAHAAAKRNIVAWFKELEGEGLDFVVINASGCGTTVKDYGFMLRNDPAWAARADAVSEITKDISEVMSQIGLEVRRPASVWSVAYHAACSLQHGQRVREEPKQLLAAAGFEVLAVPEGHLCCGSAGTYNLLQPEIAGRLLDRKIANITSLAPDLIATGNIGCMTQIGSASPVPIVHSVELLDWVSGGPLPARLKDVPFRNREKASARALEAVN